MLFNLCYGGSLKVEGGEEKVWARETNKKVKLHKKGILVTPLKLAEKENNFHWSWHNVVYDKESLKRLVDKDNILWFGCHTTQECIWEQLIIQLVLLHFIDVCIHHDGKCPNFKDLIQ